MAYNDPWMRTTEQIIDYEEDDYNPSAYDTRYNDAHVTDFENRYS